MPDICMCLGKSETIDCHLKEKCYRFTAIPDEYSQSYFMTPPIDSSGFCKHLMPLRIKPRKPKIGSVK